MSNKILEELELRIEELELRIEELESKIENLPHKFIIYWGLMFFTVFVHVLLFLFNI